MMAMDGVWRNCVFKIGWVSPWTSSSPRSSDGRLARYLLGPTPAPSECISETNQREKDKQCNRIYFVLQDQRQPAYQVSHEMYLSTKYNECLLLPFINFLFPWNAGMFLIFLALVIQYHLKSGEVCDEFCCSTQRSHFGARFRGRVNSLRTLLACFVGTAPGSS